MIRFRLASFVLLCPVEACPACFEQERLRKSDVSWYRRDMPDAVGAGQEGRSHSELPSTPRPVTMPASSTSELEMDLLVLKISDKFAELERRRRRHDDEYSLPDRVEDSQQGAEHAEEDEEGLEGDLSTGGWSLREETVEDCGGASESSEACDDTVDRETVGVARGMLTPSPIKKRTWLVRKATDQGDVILQVS